MPSVANRHWTLYLRMADPQMTWNLVIFRLDKFFGSFKLAAGQSVVGKNSNKNFRKLFFSSEQYFILEQNFEVCLDD